MVYILHCSVLLVVFHQVLPVFSFPSSRGKNNPIASLFQDMSSVFKSPAVAPSLDLEVDSWEEIRQKLYGQQTDEEREFRSRTVPYGYGKLGSPLNKIRLFDESNREEDIRVTFYRDSASWCPYW